MSATCEWDPDRGQPATTVVLCIGNLQLLPVHKRQGCPNPATVSVGQKGAWHLCDSCAKLPNFKPFRRRVPLPTPQA